MGRIITNNNSKEGSMMKWHTQAVSITNNLKFKIDSTLPELIPTKIVVWNFHMDDSTRGRYDMILGRDLFTKLVLNLKLSYFVVDAYDELFKGSAAPMVDMGKYEFKYLNTGNITPE